MNARFLDQRVLGGGIRGAGGAENKVRLWPCRRHGEWLAAAGEGQNGRKMEAGDLTVI
jgi:hypothetical protein